MRPNGRTNGALARKKRTMESSFYLRRRAIIQIATGYGIEADLTDALSNQISENIILPEFREGSYYRRP